MVGAETIPTTLDPALADDVRELQVLRPVYTPLLTYPHEGGPEGVEPVPGLARARPRVSYDGLTYTLRLRPGLRYSNGVPVRAGDFERAIERLRALDSPLAPLYAGIASIDADARTGLIRLTLTSSDPGLLQVLALPSSAPLPRGTPVRDLSRRPPAGAGAYRIERVRRRDRVVLTRAPRTLAPGGTEGHADRIAIVRAGPPAAQTRAVLSGALDVMQAPAPVSLLPEFRSVRKDRYLEETTTTTVALVPDTAAAPLYDVAVRRAIGQALDQETLTRLYRGQLEPSCNVLPAAVEGYRTLDPCPYGDRSEPADLAAAREGIEEAAPVFTRVRVESADGVPAPVVRYVAGTLRKIGLAASVGGGRGALLRVERIAPLVAHPAAYLDRFQSAGDFALSNELTAAATASSADEAADSWAAADERVVAEAYATPLGYERAPVLLSERMDAENCAVLHPVFGLDLAALCLS